MEKIFLVYGAGSGLGKSTISRLLNELCSQQGKQSRWVEEDIVSSHPAFADYVACVRNGSGDNTTTLLENAANLIADLATYPEEVVIVDSIFPCWDWLSFANVSPNEIIPFTNRLCSYLKPFQPTLIVVDGDLSAALRRAIEDRGVEDLRELAQGRLGVRDETGLVNYFLAMRETMELLLPHWPYQLIRINTVECSIEACIEVIKKEMEC